MFENEYAYEKIMRNRREELDRKLNRMAQYNHYPEAHKNRKHILYKLGVLLLSIRNIFVK